MLHRHLARAVLLAAVLSALAAPPAGAAVERHYWGRTPQGLPVTVTGFASGAPARVDAAFRVRCARRGDAWDENLINLPQVLHRTSRRFTLDTGREMGRMGEAPELVIRMEGRRVTPRGRPAAEYWHGTLEVELLYRDAGDGTIVDRCGKRTMRWRALREGHGTGRLSFTSDPGDHLAKGQAFGSGTVVAFGDAQGFGGYSPAAGSDGSWSVRFEAPPGERLRAGRTYTSALMTPDDARIFVSGPAMGQFCNVGEGEFTIDAVRYDRRGRLRSMRARFEHRCTETPDSAIRGAIRFRSRR